MDYLILYFMVTASSIKGAFLVATIAGFACGGFFIVGGYADEEDWAKRIGRKCLTVAFVAAPFAVLLPNSANFATIVGGKIVIDAAMSPEAKEVSALLLESIKRDLSK